MRYPKTNAKIWRNVRSTKYIQVPSDFFGMVHTAPLSIFRAWDRWIRDSRKRGYKRWRALIVCVCVVKLRLACFRGHATAWNLAPRPSQDKQHLNSPVRTVAKLGWA